MPTPPSFRLHCDHLQSQFILTQEGSDRRKTFESFEDAYEYAEAQATGKTPLLLYNERGRMVMKTTLSPLATELVSAPVPRRKLSLAD